MSTTPTIDQIDVQLPAGYLSKEYLTEKHPHIVIVGRIPNDLEDTCLEYKNMTRDEALVAFENDIYEMQGQSDELPALRDAMEKNPNSDSITIINFIIVAPEFMHIEHCNL